MATRVVEGKKPYTGGKAISIDENKVISLNLRDENNLIIYDEGDDEIYVDLQLDDEITPTDAFPVGVNTGRVIVDNGWDKAGTIISAVTTSGDNIKILYADDGTLWMDNGTGTFKQIYFKADVDAIAQAIWDYIHANCNTKSFGRGVAGQDVYDRISSGNNYALVNKEQNGNGTNEIFMFGPTNITTGEVSSFPAHLSQQAVGGLFYEETNVLKFDVTDGVASNIWASGTVIHNNGMLIIKDDSAPSDAIEGTTWYDTVNGVLKVYDGSSWKEVGGSDIVYATQAEYEALLPGALTDNKHYFIYSITGGGLPNAYQAVEYIQTTGTQWIDTGLYVDSNIQVETKIEQTVSVQEIPVFGSVQGDWGEADNYCCLIPYNNQWYWGTDNSSGHGGSYSSSDIGTQYTIVFNNSNSQCVVNNIQLGSTSGAKLYSPSYTLGISVRRGTNGDAPRLFGIFKYFYFKLYNKTTSQYILDLVPCYRKSDGVIGMYDLTNDVFYTNSGSGTFTKGPDVN